MCADCVGRSYEILIVDWYVAMRAETDQGHSHDMAVLSLRRGS